MPLPTSREYDAVDAGPLPHTVVNAIQDSIVALEADRTRDRIRTISASSRLIVTSTAVNKAETSDNNVIYASSASRRGIFPFELENGEQIKSWKLLCSTSHTSDHFIRCRLIRWAGVQDPSTLAVVTPWELVPGTPNVDSAPTAGEELLQSAASPLPLTGSDEYAYGLLVENQLGGAPLGSIQFGSIQLVLARS